VGSSHSRLTSAEDNEEASVEGVGDVKWQDRHVTWRGQEISLSLVDGKITVIKRE
jgi:hypothetical protein